MKALSVLQTLKQAIELSHFNNSGVTFGKNTIAEINEAIADLEDQLNNTEQLTCGMCNPECFHYDVETSKEYCPCKNCVLYVANKHIHNYYKPKDTK